MADVVSSNVIANSPNEYVVKLLNLSDGTGESAVTKVDITSALLSNQIVVQAPGQQPQMATVQPKSLDLVSVQWSIFGFTDVLLYWFHTTNALIDVLCPGNGRLDYREWPSDFVGLINNAMLKDPRGTGGNGSVLITTEGNIAGARYDITLHLRKNYV